MGISAYFWPKKSCKKNCLKSQRFQLYQVTMHNFLYQNVWVFSLYILLRKQFKHFGQKMLFWKQQQSLSRKNHTRKIIKICKDFESKSPSIISCLQCQYSHYLYCLQEESFELLFINQKWFHFFLLIICHIPISPSCRVPC